MAGPLPFTAATPRMSGHVSTAGLQLRKTTGMFSLSARQSVVKAAGIQVVPIYAAAWKVEAMRPYLLTWLRQYASIGNKVFKETVRTWKRKPRFWPISQSAHYSRTEGTLGITIGTDDHLWAALNRGTARTPVEPKGANYRDAKGNPLRAKAWKFQELDASGRVIHQEVRKDPRPRLAFITPFTPRTSPGVFSSGETHGGKEGYSPGSKSRGYKSGLRRPLGRYLGVAVAKSPDVGGARRVDPKAQAKQYHVRPRQWDVQVAAVLQTMMAADIQDAVKGLMERVTQKYGTAAGYKAATKRTKP